MRRINPIFIVIAFFSIAVLGIPTIVVSFGKEQRSTIQNEVDKVNVSDEDVSNNPSLDVAVFRNNLNEVENIPLEDYVAGVVASETFPTFETEALKAQALVARTYIIKRLLGDTKLGVPKNIDADVTDSENHQVYKSESELIKSWGKNYEVYMSKIRDAVEATKGMIVTYEGQPIEASFFSTSNGYTENSEAIWQSPTPYLQSVESKWDTDSPYYKRETKMSVQDFETKLGIKLGTTDSIANVVSTTPGKRIGVIEIGGKQFNGKDVRNKLKLVSTDFRIERNRNEIIIHTKGSGHGVGMSQFGANGMAKEGKTYEEIINYYYKGVTIDTADDFINKLIVKVN